MVAGMQGAGALARGAQALSGVTWQNKKKNKLMESRDCCWAKASVNAANNVGNRSRDSINLFFFSFGHVTPLNACAPRADAPAALHARYHYPPLNTPPLSTSPAGSLCRTHALAACRLHHLPIRLSRVPSTLTNLIPIPCRLALLHACHPSQLPPSSHPCSLVPSTFHPQPTSFLTSSLCRTHACMP